MWILLANSLYLGGNGFTFIMTINFIYHFTGDIKIIVGNAMLSRASHIPALQRDCYHSSWVRRWCENYCGTTELLHHLLGGRGAGVMERGCIFKLFHVDWKEVCTHGLDGPLSCGTGITFKTISFFFRSENCLLALKFPPNKTDLYPTALWPSSSTQLHRWIYHTVYPFIGSWTFAELPRFDDE